MAVYKMMSADKIPSITYLIDNPVKLLAVDSGVYDCISDPYDKLKNGDRYSSIMPDLERFGEMIVIKCAELVADFSAQRIPANEYSKLLKQSFEIKEKV